MSWQMSIHVSPYAAQKQFIRAEQSARVYRAPAMLDQIEPCTRIRPSISVCNTILGQRILVLRALLVQ
jgi:hypothetical protein